MKIGTIGSGHVGGALGKRWAAEKHEVIFSSRHPGSDQMKKLLAQAGPNATVGSVDDAVEKSDILVLAVPWSATEQLLTSTNGLAGKILIDATNPLLPDLAGLTVGTTESGGELISKWSRGARVVKAFNMLGANIMASPDFSGKSPALLYCGDDTEAKKVVHSLVAELGLDPLDVGPLKQSRLLEPMALLWISMAMQYGYSREIAWQLLRR